MSPEPRECRLFVYGTLRQGEAQHELLAGAPLLGVVSTVPTFHLVDVGPYAALVRGGGVAVSVSRQAGGAWVAWSRGRWGR